MQQKQRQNKTLLTVFTTSVLSIILTACSTPNYAPQPQPTPAPVVPETPADPVVEPIVVAPEPVEYPEVIETPAEYPEYVTAPQQRYVVQLTASSSQTKAEGIKNLFAGDGYNAFVSPLMLDGRLLHRVQIGYFKDQDMAGTVLAQLKSNYPQDVYVANAIVKTP